MLIKSKNKPQFSGHETFPLRQLWPRKAYDGFVQTKNNLTQLETLFTESSIPRFGVGKNMVSAIKHWALACDILKEDNLEHYQLGFTGSVIFESKIDEYIEHLASIWLIHWQLAGKANKSTTWSWLFNYIGFQPFDRGSVLQLFKQLAIERKLKVADTTLKRDIDVCLRCYAPKILSKDMEDSLDPLLLDLKLLEELPNGMFQILGGEQTSLPLSVFTYALIDFWDENEKKSSALSFEKIAHGVGSPGRIFKLSEQAVSERLLLIEEISEGKLNWVDSSGVKQVIKIDEEIFSNQFKYNLLLKAYVE